MRDRRGDRYAGLRSRMQRGAVDEGIREEFEHHLESRIEEYVAAGMTRTEAEEEARRRIGDMDRYREETRRIDDTVESGRRRRELMDGLRREGQHAVRSLIRSPLFSLVAILTLGLGLGATGSIFTLLDGVVLRPLPYPSSDRLIWIASWATSGGTEGEWGLSPAGYFHYRANQRTLDAFGVYTTQSVTISGEGDAVRVEGVAVSAGLLDAIGARPVAGRLLTAEDDAPGAAPAVLLSHAFWQRNFGGDRSIVGRTINVDAQPVEVAGVLAEGIQLPDRNADVWFALGLDPAGPFFNSHYLSGIGRLTAGATVESARSDLARLTAQFTELFPSVYPSSFMSGYGFRVEVSSLRARVLGNSVRTLWILFASVGLVLVIACVNVANLFVVRSEVRRREASVRAALGAGRSALVWNAMAESLVVALAASAIAVALTWAATGTIRSLAGAGLPRIESVGVRPVTVLVILALALLSGIVLGMLPLLRRHDVSAVLREGGRGQSASGRQHRLRAVLVTAQFALALVLLAAAGLMLRSFERLRSVDPGFEADGVLKMSLALPSVRYPDAPTVSTFYRDLSERIEALPGVVRASISTSLPLGGFACGLVFVKDRPLEPGDPAPCLAYVMAEPGYFESLGIRVQGRTPGWDDETGGTGAVVISRAVAEQFWPGEEAIGRSIRPNGAAEPYYTVVGVTEDVRAYGLDEPAPAIVYYPMTPISGAPLWGVRRYVSLAVRTSTVEPITIIPAIRRIVSEMDPDVPLANIETMETALSRSMARRTFAMTLLMTAAVLALALSAVGIYGVVSYVVGHRRAEIGIRMALGARAAMVSSMIVRQSLRMALAGIIIGLGFTLLAARSLGALLFEVEPADPPTLLGVSILLVMIAIIASWAPARRAASVDPLDVMRNE